MVNIGWYCTFVRSRKTVGELIGTPLSVKPISINGYIMLFFLVLLNIIQTLTKLNETSGKVTDWLFNVAFLDSRINGMDTFWLWPKFHHLFWCHWSIELSFDEFVYSWLLTYPLAVLPMFIKNILIFITLWSSPLEYGNPVKVSDDVSASLKRETAILRRNIEWICFWIKESMMWLFATWLVMDWWMNRFIYKDSYDPIFTLFNFNTIAPSA